MSKPGQLSEMSQSSIGNLVSRQAQRFKLGQHCQLFHSSIGNQGLGKNQRSQLGKTFEVYESGVSDLRPRHFEILEFGQPSQSCKSCVGEFELIEIQRLSRSVLR